MLESTPPPTPLVASFDDLVALLARDRVPHEVDGQVVFVPTERNGIRAVLAMEWRAQEGLLQLASAIPLEVPAPRVAAVAAALARINHALPVPGLDFDLERRALAYRVVLPLAPRNAVEAGAIQSCFRLAIRVAAMLHPSLRLLVDGALAPDAVVADLAARITKPAQNAGAAPQAQPPRADKATRPALPRPFWLVDSD
jgi:hypothetical protein